MKKFTKICLIICGALTALGLIFCLIGAGLGFTYQQFRAMAWNGVFSYGPEDRYEEEDAYEEDDDYDDDHDYDNHDYDEHDEHDDHEVSWDEEGTLASGETEKNESDWKYATEAWAADDIRNLDIEFDFGSLCIEPSDGEEIEIIVEYRSLWNSYSRTINWKKDGDTLKVKDTVDQKILKLFTHHVDDATMTLRIPEGKVFDEVTLDIGAAKVGIGTMLSASEMDITLGAGELLSALEQPLTLEADELKLEIGAGNMEISGIQTSLLDVECGTGEMKLTDVTAQIADIDCGVGHISMKMTGRQADYNYEVDCGIGQVVVGESSFSGLGQSKQISNGGSKSMDIDCGIGQVEISFEE